MTNRSDIRIALPSKGRLAEGSLQFLEKAGLRVHKLKDLFDIIESRKASMPKGSYTAKMIRKGEDEILKKIGEEAVEVILASKGQGDVRLIEEVSDLFYHTLILLAARGLTLQNVEDELRRRHNLAQIGAEG